jgi:hypothetical protein
MGNGQEISGQNVGERICEVPAILEGSDGRIMELAVMPVGREPAIEEMSQGNGGVEPIVGVPVILSVAVAEVECVAGEELPVIVGSVGDSESDSVAGSSGGRLSEFNFIGKTVVGAFSRWLHCFGGSQLFYGIRELVLGKVAGEFVLVRRSPRLYRLPGFQFNAPDSVAYEDDNISKCYLCYRLNSS